MRVTLTKEQLISIHSLGIGASRDDVTPVITQIALKREGDALRGMATDRYMVLSGIYSGVEFEDWEEGDTILVDPSSLKRAIDIKKSHKNNTLPIVIMKNEYGAVSALFHTLSLVDLGHVQGGFPPVMRLFPTDKPNGAGSLNIRPDFLAKLAKVLPPVDRPERNRAWRFEFRTLTDQPGKPQPVYAQYSDAETYKLEALIQPALPRE